jgi:uncharacterized protein
MSLPPEQNLASEEQIESMTSHVAQEFERVYQQADDAPLKVAVMGQTGVGKSSLLNALFGTRLPTDAVKPTTKAIEEIPIQSPGKHLLYFYDMPGIGESAQADQIYYTHYQRLLLEADVVLWCLYTDNRSITFDQEAFAQLIQHMDEVEKAVILSKITLVLTKADVLTNPPWLFYLNGNEGLFEPDDAVKAILERKEAYFQATFLAPYGHLITARTYLPEGSTFTVQEEGFSSNRFNVSYKGWLEKEKVAQLVQKYPHYKDIFERLYNSYRVIPCSALYRYNLSEVMLTVLNKLGGEAYVRFGHFVSSARLGNVPLSHAKTLSNIVIFDMRKGKRIFDLDKNIHKL